MFTTTTNQGTTFCRSHELAWQRNDCQTHVVNLMVMQLNLWRHNVSNGNNHTDYNVHAIVDDQVISSRLLFSLWRTNASKTFGQNRRVQPAVLSSSTERFTINTQANDIGSNGIAFTLAYHDLRFLYQFDFARVSRVYQTDFFSLTIARPTSSAGDSIALVGGFSIKNNVSVCLSRVIESTFFFCCPSRLSGFS